MNTPDTEVEGIVEEFMWQMKGDQHSICGQYIPAFCDKQEKRLRTLISSRDTYWKEGVRKTINEIHQVDPDDMNTYYTSGQKAEIRAYNQALTDILQALDNLK